MLRLLPKVYMISENMSSTETLELINSASSNSNPIRMLRPSDDDRPAGAEQPVGVPPDKAVPPSCRHLLLLLDLLQHPGKRLSVAGKLEGPCVRVPKHLLGLLQQSSEQRVVQALCPHHEPLPPSANIHREAALHGLAVSRRRGPAPVQRLGD
ncbi:hypothetical protein D1007_33112 [Hordeum vulgare]|nr:hypothetical protein D1007_33112 [Hordeum vulgare]